VSKNTADRDGNPTSSSAQQLSQAERSGGRLVLWMLGLGIHYTWRCLLVLLLNLVVMGLSLAVLTVMGLNFDLIGHTLNPGHAQAPRWFLGLHPPADWSPLKVLIVVNAVLGGLALLRAIFRFAAALSQGHLIQVILSDLRKKIYDKLQRLSFRFFDANDTGTLINRGTSDASAIPTFIDFAIVQVVILLISLGVNLTYMINIQPVLTLICLITTPLLGVASIIYSRKVRPAYEENRKLFDKVVLRLSENIQGQHVVKGFALEQHEIGRFAKANDDLRRQQRWLFKRSSVYSATVNFLTQLNLVLVLLAGGYIVIRDSGNPDGMTVGELVVFAGLLQQISTQVASISNIANTLQVSLTAARRVQEVLTMPMDVRNRPNPVRLARPTGRMRFENVTFGYKPDEPILHEINLEVEPGRCIAILGATGSGKSTLLSQIPRFYDPTSGRITLDGHDLRDVELNDLRRSIGLVFQESFLFSNTVAFNIAFGNPSATPEQIEQAARIASAHSFIMDLPRGYDTVIGEYGSSLSGGQRQRLAIARAVLPNPSILILDDATAAIDPETEHEIHQAMDQAMSGRTIFMVAHRLSTLRRADQIIVLDQGRIVQTGTHDQLMHKLGHYSKIARMQLVDEESRYIIQARRWYEGQTDTPMPREENIP
jgi:ATP-binding cassette subfamily B protein